MFKHIYTTLLFPTLIDRYLINSINELVTDLIYSNFDTFTQHQKFTIAYLLSNNKNIAILGKLLAKKDLAFNENLIQFFNTIYEPKQYTETCCPITTDPIIRETGLLYKAGNSFFYIADENAAMIKLNGICPVSREEMDWVVRLVDIDDNTFTSLIAVSTNEKKETIPLDELIHKFDDNQLENKLKECSVKPEELPISRLNIFNIEFEGATPFHSLMMSSEGQRCFLEHVNTLLSNITAETWNRHYTQGPKTGITPFHLLISTPEGRQCFFDHADDLPPKIAAETWNLPFTQGPNTGTTPLHLMMSTIKGLRYILKHADALLPKIAAETWNRPFTQGPNTGITPFHLFIFSPEARRCFFDHAYVLLPKITTDTWNRPIAEGPNAGATPVHCIMFTPEGQQCFFENANTLLPKITTDTWNRPIPEGPNAGITLIHSLMNDVGYKFIYNNWRHYSTLPLDFWQSTVNIANEKVIDFIENNHATLYRLIQMKIRQAATSNKTSAKLFAKSRDNSNNITSNEKRRDRDWEDEDHDQSHRPTKRS